VIYEVNVRQYTPEGSFAAFEEHLPRLKELGVDILWFMPIYPISQTERKGSLGSYYAISDYQAVNPEFGSLADFKNLVEKAHRLGFKVILDWVANHTGWDNRWISEHPDWYVRDSVGNIVSPYDWTDTAELDYSNPDLRKAMIEAMRFWLQECNIDGFRCDVAMEVPTDFWDAARQSLDSVKPVFMLAEAELPELQRNAFDADYAWEMLHLMNDVAKGEKTANNINEYLQKLDTSYFCGDALKMNFITNHDENSWNGSEIERLGEANKSCAVLTYMLNGMPLIYSGQETGMYKRLEFFEKDTVPSWEKNDYFAFYRRLNELKHTYSALKAGVEGGETKIVSTTNNNVLIIARKSGNETILALLNLANTESEFEISANDKKAEYLDWFLNEKIENLPTRLAPWEYKVLVKM
jgi:glycosidase